VKALISASRVIFCDNQYKTRILCDEWDVFKIVSDISIIIDKKEMVESGKRSRPQRDYDGDANNQKRHKDDKGTNNDGLIVYRILCPDGVIGSVIGKSGKVINSIRHESRARVKVVDPFPGAKDRIITIYCHIKEKEDVDVDDDFNHTNPLCPAQDALLKVHAAISNAVASLGDSDKRLRDKEECQILVPASQSANIIGKAGATIKRLRSKTRTSIKIIAKDATDPTHSCAMDFDNFLLVSKWNFNVLSIYLLRLFMWNLSVKT
jgi:poly(rC)-binding protein 2/3/4